MTFLTDEEKARETPAERRRRRAGAGLDRSALNRLAITVGLLFGGLLVLVAADVAGLERKKMIATVQRMRDVAHGRQCVTELATPLGDAHITFRNACRFAPWHLGDGATVVVRRTRLTRSLVVETRGTIFSGAYSLLPE